MGVPITVGYQIPIPQRKKHLKNLEVTNIQRIFAEDLLRLTIRKQAFIALAGIIFAIF